MLITQQVEVSQPIDSVWTFFGDIPQVAACLPGTNLTDQTGDDRFEGDVIIKAGPVKLEFAGSAEIRERDEANRTITVDASGADRKGRGQAELALTAALVPLVGEPESMCLLTSPSQVRLLIRARTRCGCDRSAPTGIWRQYAGST